MAEQHEVFSLKKFRRFILSPSYTVLLITLHKKDHKNRKIYARRTPKTPLNDPKVEDKHYDDDAGHRALHVQRLPVQIGGVLFVFLRQHRQVLRLGVQLGEDRAPLQHVVNVLNLERSLALDGKREILKARRTHHYPLHVLQLRVDRVDVPPAIGQRLFRLLDVDVELDERVRSRHRVDLAAVVVVELLGDVLEVAERDALGKHFVTQHQIADVVFDQIAEGI